jgi:hypothetical protein
LQVSPQIVPTSATHVESQLCEQQNESEPQTFATQDAQLFASALPIEQYACEQVLVPPPIEHVFWPQTEATSLMHWLFHEVVQQKLSTAQIWLTQGSHDDTSLPPLEHLSCEQLVALARIQEIVEVSTSAPMVPLTPMPYVPGAAVPGDSVSVVD